MKKPAEIQVISKSYLAGLIIKSSLFFCVGLLLTGVVLYFSAHQPLGPSYQESFSRLSQLKQEMLYKSIVIYTTLMLVIMAGVTFTTVMYSHRVVGPMIGLKRVLGLIISGDLTTPAVLRTKDAIKPTATALNDMMSNYQHIVETISTTTSEMKKISSLPETPENLNLISEKSTEISQAINQLKF